MFQNLPPKVQCLKVNYWCNRWQISVIVVENASVCSNAESLSTEAVLKGIKRPNTTQEMDSEHSVKKIHLEA